jgi:arylsulfatase A-like enzyme
MLETGAWRGKSKRVWILLPVIFLCLLVGAKEAPREADVGSVSEMPNVRSGLVERGTTFDRAFATTPLCCPSRTSILRGQYAHNHNLWDNKAPDGGFRGFQELGLEESTVATWLDEAGYHTGFIGKYLNEYGDYEHPTTHVPADATAPNDNAYGGRTMPKTPAFNEADLSDKAALWRDNALRLVQGAEAASRCWRTSSRRWRWGRL